MARGELDYLEFLQPVLESEDVWTMKKPRGKVFAMYAGYKACSEARELQLKIEACCREKFGADWMPDYNFYDHNANFETMDKRCLSIYRPYHIDQWFDIIDLAWEHGIYIRLYGGHPPVIAVRARIEGESKPKLPSNEYLSFCGINIYKYGLCKLGEH